MSVVELTINNFTPDNRGTILRIRGVSPGLYLTMFKMQGCPACVQLWPVFNQLAQRNPGVRFFSIDVSRFRDVIGMSQKTTTPVEHVPMFIFYVDGIPKSKYTGDLNINSLNKYVGEMAARFASASATNFVTAPQRPMGMGMPQHPHPQQYAGPRPTSGMVNASQAVQGQNLGIGMSQQELERLHNSADVKVVPEGIIPHNAPWTQYKGVNLDYSG